MFPTLNRKSLEEGWGFSLIGGVDYLQAAGQFSGIVTRKGETGLWLKVSKKYFLEIIILFFHLNKTVSSLFEL